MTKPPPSFPPGPWRWIAYMEDHGVFGMAKFRLEASDGTLILDGATRPIDLIAALPDLLSTLHDLVEAKALSGVRGIVAGWNGEGKLGSPYPRHPSNLGATLPKTTCGAVYELDEALTNARAAIAKALG